MTSRFWKRNSELPLHDVTHRAIGEMPDITPANDIFSYEEGYLVIKNPSVRTRNYYAE